MTLFLFFLQSVDSESIVRFGWHNMWSFLGSILDILRCYIIGKGCDKDAHSKGVCYHCIQRNPG